MHHNVVRNASELWGEGEALRRSGQVELARERYRGVVRKTEQALGARPAGDWAYEAQLLRARANIRLGLYSEAEEALRVVRDGEADAGLRARAGVWASVIRAEVGDREGSLRILAQSLSGPLPREAAAEAHLLRGRLLLDSGESDLAAWDLDRAADANPDTRVEARVARLRAALEREDEGSAREALRLLFGDEAAAPMADTMRAMIIGATLRSGPGWIAALLEGVEEARWDRNTRGRMTLVRARLLRAVGDSAAAVLLAESVADGLGAEATEARVDLARWRFETARDLSDLREGRDLLVAVEEDGEARRLRDAVGRVEDHAEAGFAEPLHWFRAAEVARDELVATQVAWGFFMTYAEAASHHPWVPKALLAALDVTSIEGDRGWLLGRLERFPESPYVLAAFGRPAAGFEDLEEELAVRLSELTGR